MIDDRVVSRRGGVMHAFFHDVLPVATAILLPACVVGLGYLAYRLGETGTRLAVAEERLAVQAAANASTTTSLLESITLLQENLSLTKTASDALAANLDIERDKISSLQEATSDIGASVGTLEKLRETDPELLIKYSKVSFLNENYVPKRLSEIRNEYLYSERKTQLFLADALPFLTDMLDAARRDGIELYVHSAYRSFNEQDHIKNAYSMTYGSGANAFSADQGYSEHQLGTTVDLLTTGVGGVLTTSFAQTRAYTWLEQNAYKYGFILSYPKGNTYYIYEPWHWRFVGTSLARRLRDDSIHFYDVDQRVIDGYLVSMFDR